MKTTTATTIKLFGKAIETENNIHFSEINKIAIQFGYLVSPHLCNTDVRDWLLEQKRDYNTTFYKKWNDIISKNRFELYIDQILHYASTYGTDYTGEAYLPAGAVEVPDFTKFKVISPITKEEVISRCEKMLFSGIALQQETIEDLLFILNNLNHVLDIEKVKNKEAKMYLYTVTATLPTDPVEMVRLLVYLSTNKTLLIKDKATIDAIKASPICVDTLIRKFGIKKLSSVFYRFKPIFLAFKKRGRDALKNADAYTINELRRLAVKNHVPSEKTYFETILSNPKNVVSLPEKLKGLGNFKKITLLQTILVRLVQQDIKVFGIRNQKIFMTKQAENKVVNTAYLKMVYDIIYADLVESLRAKACTINIPKGINITLPTSEKSFIGNYPLGTSFDFSKTDNIVGINWKGEDGAQDLDLKLIDINGKQYGWNASYYNNEKSIVFSGDMTSAYPEATELFYTTKGFTPSIVKVNLYNGNNGSKFKFFIAKEEIESMTRNYMVNPDNIIVNVDCVMDSSEKSLGVITGDKFVLAQFRTGKGRVAGDSITNQYTDYALKTLGCYLSLEKVLTDAGFVITDKEPAIDLADLSKDTLIDLLSK